MTTGAAGVIVAQSGGLPCRSSQMDRLVRYSAVGLGLGMITTSIAGLMAIPDRDGGSITRLTRS